MAFGRTSILGLADNQASQKDAEALALEDCRNQGGLDCQISLAYHNQCAAVAWGETTGTTARAPTIEEASNIAMSNCRKKTGDCQIYYTNCVKAARVR